jgi:hypothetical protein
LLFFKENLNTILTIWAGLGPLAAGVVANLWNRKIQIEDRRYEETKFERQQKLSNQDRTREKIVALKKETVSETKRLILNFLDKTNSYVQFVIKIHSYVLSERPQNCLEGLQMKQVEMTNSFNELFINISEPNLLKSCRNLLNEVTGSCPDFNVRAQPRELSDYAIKFADKRTDVLHLARIYLQNLEQEIVNIETQEI